MRSEGVELCGNLSGTHREHALGLSPTTRCASLSLTTSGTIQLSLSCSILRIVFSSLSAVVQLRLFWDSRQRSDVFFALMMITFFIPER